MRKGSMRKRWQPGWVVLGGIAALLLPGPAGAADERPAARVSAVIGDTTSAGAALAPRGSLAEGAEVETGADGGCSLLLDDTALLELCAGTQLRLTRVDGAPDGPRVIELERGEIRVLVEPGALGEPSVVKTPAAIVTVLGPIVHVAVGAHGVTTISASTARVTVESSTEAMGATTLSAGQQLVVEPGQAPTRPVRLSSEQRAALGSCLIDFQQATLGRDRGAQLDLAVDDAVRDVLADVESADLALGLGSGRPQRPVDDLDDLIERPGPGERFRPLAEDQVSSGAADEAISEILSENGGQFPPCCDPPAQAD